VAGVFTTGVRKDCICSIFGEFEKMFNFIIMQHRTDVILNQFADSWNETEDFFRNLVDDYDWRRKEPVLKFIEDRRKSGDDKFFRIGTSVDGLIISRSINLGLRIDQKFIRIDTYDNKFNVILRDGEKVYREYLLDDLNDPKLIGLLNTLKHTLVD
jgi:hypothetical protein